LHCCGVDRVGLCRLLYLHAADDDTRHHERSDQPQLLRLHIRIHVHHGIDSVDGPEWPE
jgi:hypothetical protein